MNDELDLFSFVNPTFKIKHKIRLIELFSGIGAQAKALERLGADFEHWRAIEIDKYAMASYNAVHGTDFETSDITQIHASDLGITERENYCYIMTYSFPCQDLSLVGQGKGMKKGSGTRSGLLWEVERILDECEGNLPQVLLMENVPPVIGKKNIKDFQAWRSKLESLGYSNFVQLLNSKDYGIPQNRNRCFMVSILGEWHYDFPKKIPLKLRLKDMLEEKVDEKYYLSEKAMNYITNPKRLEKKYTEINGELSIPVTAKGQQNWTGSFVADGNLRERAKAKVIPSGFLEKGTGEHQSNIVYDEEGLSRTIQATDGMKTPPMMILERESTHQRCAPEEEVASTDTHGISSLTVQANQHQLGGR